MLVEEQELHHLAQSQSLVGKQESSQVLAARAGKAGVFQESVTLVTLLQRLQQGQLQDQQLPEWLQEVKLQASLLH